MELTGILIVKNDTNQVSDKFKKREFVIERTEIVGQKEFTDYIKFELKQDKCSLIDSVNCGDNIKVQFNVRGNKWEKDGKVMFFTNLEAWKIEVLNAVNDVQDLPEVDNLPDDNSDLPF